jgi:hypothetical protein
MVSVEPIEGPARPIFRGTYRKDIGTVKLNRFHG